MISAAPGKAMELEGNLRAFQLSDILRFLAMGKMSGVLTLIGPDGTIHVTIKDGLITGAGSGDRFPRLGQMLIYNGAITRKVLDEVLDTQRDGGTGQMLGEILIERGLVDRAQVEDALRLQIREELWTLFSWTDGTFKFEHGLNPALERSLVALEIEPLIEEGAEQMEQWRAIDGKLGDPGQVFRATAEMALQPDLRLTPNVWRVLSLVNGRHNTQVLIYLSGLGRFETLCALDRLLSVQLIEPRPKHPRPAAPSQPAPAPDPSSVDHQAITESDEEDTGEGRRGLFGRWRRQANRVPAQDPAPGSDSRQAQSKPGGYLTGVGLACALIGRLAARLCAEPECRAEGGAEALLESLWNGVALRFPRADLIVPREGRLDPSAYEAYVKLAGGVNEALAGCHEDAMEALARVGEHLAQQARERLGDRARKLVTDAIKPYLECTDIKYTPEFMPRAWAERWTGISN